MRRKYEKEDILNIGQSLIRRQGYHNTGINDLLKEAGIPKGSFYNFFNSKEDFALQVLDAYGENNYQWMASFLNRKNQSPIDRLKAFYLDAMRINQSSEDACSKGCLINNMAMEVGGLSDSFAHSTNKQFSRLLSLISPTIEEGQQLGQFRTDYPALELAEFIHTNFFGALSRMKSTRSPKPLERAYQMSLEFLTYKTEIS